jgi:hypothetical protein
MKIYISRRRTRLLAILAILLAVLLVLCPYLPFIVFDVLRGGVLSLLASYQINSVAHSLPIPSGSNMILSLEGRYSTGNEDCFMYKRYEIYGNNQLPIEELLNFYSSSLSSEQWKPGGRNEDGEWFWIEDRGFGLGIDDNINLDWDPLVRGLFGPGEDFINKIDAAERQFKTAYIVSFNLYPMDARGQEACHDWMPRLPSPQLQ